ncbi:hypothetical protein GV794_24405 [Nocardia cyriacigeorgica]|uniref:Uncharacterized protein n=1 Tax=Nocardia cyriacigeorgica TaxID=135487 RepID=A0A6P1DC01_9NOCA|nr:hypothetical protein [Nocardia cyriacigeorgica]NEW46173.1 hypothetical protein [Nocardia cyriacigeorgica]NEW50597.1 hypothetical protein [Nocardia cyriacigeorgica]NEW58755.1 hypothetical protein [Nocardia cyriacigeorgica]
MRGAFVGSASGAVSIAAHALGGGVVTPGSPSVTLLLGACALIGMVARALPVRPGSAQVMLLLTAGQAIGHLALTAAPGHHHGSGSAAIMLVAHLLAIPVGAVLIHGAEQAARRAVSSVHRAVAALCTALAAPPPWAPRSLATSADPLIPPRPLLTSGAGTRGPPASAW